MLENNCNYMFFRNCNDFSINRLNIAKSTIDIEFCIKNHYTLIRVELKNALA